MCIALSVAAASSGLCVTNIIVLLNSRDKRVNKLKTSIPVFVSKFAVGSSARMILEDSLEGFLSTVNGTLGEINELNNTNAIVESRSTLHVFLRESDETIKSIKQQLDNLKIISAKLL
jgi:hypothetical protein